MTMKRTILLITLLLLPILTMGCARSNAIKLTYKTMEEPARCPGEVVVFRFTDQRENKERLGWHQNGNPIMAKSDVVDWIGWSIFDELMAAGADAKYRTTTVSGDETVVTGEILEVKLDQTGKTTFKGRVGLNIRVQKKGKDVHVERFISEVEDVALPGYGTQSDILAAALQGAIATALPVICENL